MGSNGTVDERLAEAEEARAALGAAWRTNLRWPDRAIGGDPDHVRAAAQVIRNARPRPSPCRTGLTVTPITARPVTLLTEAVFNAGLRRYDAGAEPWRPAWTVYYFINDRRPAVVCRRRVGPLSTEARALACHRSQFSPARAQAVETRLTSPLFLQLVESSDAQFGAQAGVQLRRGSDRPRAARAGASFQERPEWSHA